MPSFYVDLLVRAFFAIPPSLGGNMLGLIWPVIVILCGEIIACFVYGWRTVKDKWRQASLIGLAALGICYTVLFGWCALVTNYQDHLGLSSKVVVLQQAYDTNSEHTKYAVLEAQSKCAEMVGENTTLGKQNRDQQNTINNCQTQALKLLTPVPLKLYSILINDNKNMLEQANVATFLVTSNMMITPIDLHLQCDQQIAGIKIRPAKYLELTVGGGSTIKGASADVNQQSPALTPATPVIIHVGYTGTSTIDCAITQK